MMRRLPALCLTAVAVAVALALTLPPGGYAAPGLRLAIYPPTWDTVQVFRAIVLGGAKPVSATPLPGAWLVHLDPGQPDRLPGALTTGAGPFIRLASAACLTPPERQ